MDAESQRMYQLIAKYKPDNYTTCSPEDTLFINNYIDKKLKQKDFGILTDLQKVDFGKYPVNQDFDLNAHYKDMYKGLGKKNFPTYENKKISYSHNIKNVYNRNRNIEDKNGLDRIFTIFEKISNPQIGASNKALKELSNKYNIVFNIIEGNSFDGECRYQKVNAEDMDKSIIISVTQGALNANDDALAVLLGHELSHGIDLSRMPNNYIGSIGWEAPEDFANITGASIAKNAGYNPLEFIKAQGKNNDKTQRAADMIQQYVINSKVDNKLIKLREKIAKSKSDRATELDIVAQTTKPPYKPKIIKINPVALRLHQRNNQNG